MELRLSIKTLTNFKIETKDGTQYKVLDILINEENWRIKYLKVDIGNYLVEHIVVVPRFLIEYLDFKKRKFVFGLFDSDLANCPSFKSELPISDCYEKELEQFYSQEDYWARQYYPPRGTPNLIHNCILPPEKITSRLDKLNESELKSSLRSLNELIGYEVISNNGKVGKIHDFVIGTKDWEIQSAVVKFKGPLGVSTKKVITARQWIEEVSYTDQSIRMDLEKKEVKNSVPFSLSAGVNKLFKKEVLDFQGKPTDG